MSEFVLQTDGNSYANSRITSVLLRDLVEGLSRGEVDFIVLEPREPINGSAYLQALGAFVVEIRLLAEDGSFTQYSYTSDDKDEVLSMFLRYWEHGELPALDGWKDITASLRKRASPGLLSKIGGLLRGRRAPAQIPIDDDATRKGTPY